MISSNNLTNVIFTNITSNTTMSIEYRLYREHNMSQESSKLKSVSRCYVSDEGISFHADGTTSYMIQIEDFTQKMDWTPGTKITSQVR